jgi:hypothetical protein
MTRPQPVNPDTPPKSVVDVSVACLGRYEGKIGLQNDPNSPPDSADPGFGHAVLYGLFSGCWSVAAGWHVYGNKLFENLRATEVRFAARIHRPLHAHGLVGRINQPNFGRHLHAQHADRVTAVALAIRIFRIGYRQNFKQSFQVTVEPVGRWGSVWARGTRVIESTEKIAPVHRNRLKAGGNPHRGRCIWGTSAVDVQSRAVVTVNKRIYCWRCLSNPTWPGFRRAAGRESHNEGCHQCCVNDEAHRRRSHI